MQERPAKVLFVLGILDVNGVTASLLSLLRTLSEDVRYEISLFTYTPIQEEFLRRIPSSVRILPLVDEYQAIALPLKDALLLALRKRRIDILRERARRILRRMVGWGFRRDWSWLPNVQGDWDVACGYADGFLSEQVIRKVVARRKVLWVHENYEDTRPSKSVMEAFRDADKVVCVSQDAVGHFEAWFGSAIGAKACVIHNVTDSDRCARLAVADGMKAGVVPTLVSVGRLSPEKGYDMVPEIVRILNSRGIVFEWQIVGGGIMEIENILKAVKGVVLLGRQDNPYPYIKNAKLLVSLSRAEGWGMNISEALALHKPVVVSDIAVYREQVSDGVNGFCVSRTPEAFADAIGKLLTDASLYEKMCVAANCEMCSPSAVRCEFAAMMETLR